MRKVFNINFYQDKYMDLFLPEKEEFFTIIHFHGGGLVEGDKGDTHEYVKHLVDLGFAVYTANYSLYPNAKFPDYLIDAANAVKYAKEHIKQFGKSKGIIISGQSAGAWITLMLCFNKDYLKQVGIDNSEIVGWISDSAQTTSHFHIIEIEQGLDPLTQRIDETAPLFYVNKETRFSNLLLMCYEEDLANRLEQNKLLVSTIKNFNKDAKVTLKVLSGGHCSGSSKLDSDGEYATIKEIKKWVKTI